MPPRRDQQPRSLSPIVSGQTSGGNYLVYFMANQAIYRPEAGSDRGLDVNFGFDWTPDDITQVISQVTGGVRYCGPIPHRRQLVFQHYFDVGANPLSHNSTVAGFRTTFIR